MARSKWLGELETRVAAPSKSDEDVGASNYAASETPDIRRPSSAFSFSHKWRLRNLIRHIFLYRRPAAGLTTAKAKVNLLIIHAKTRMFILGLDTNAIWLYSVLRNGDQIIH